MSDQLKDVLSQLLVLHPLIHYLLAILRRHQEHELVIVQLQLFTNPRVKIKMTHEHLTCGLDLLV